MQEEAVGAGWGPATAGGQRTAAQGTRVLWRQSTSRGSRTTTGTESRELEVFPPVRTL